MGRKKEVVEKTPFNQIAKKLGAVLGLTPDLAKLTEVPTPFGPLNRIGRSRVEPDIPPKYQSKKHLFDGLIENEPVVILFFSGEVYGQDETYFRQIYQNSRDIFSGPATQFTERKIAPNLLGFDDEGMTLIIEKARHDLSHYILFIDVGKPGFLPWLSMLSQFYQATVEKAPHSLFSQILKEEVGKILQNYPQAEMAVKLFNLGRMNRYLIGCTLRNIIFTTEVDRPVDENRIRDFLAKVRYLAEIDSPKEAISYASDEFDSDWRERLKDYPKAPEFQKNLKMLKAEVDQNLPSEKPKRKLVFVLMGIGGSGKSSLARIIGGSLHPSVILRSDWIFFEKLRDQIEADYYRAYVYQEELARRYLREGYSVIMDDNNRTVKNRRGVYQWAKTLGAKPVLIVIDVNPEIAAERVTIKGGEAWKKGEMLEGLKASCLDLEPPTSEEREQVKIIKIDGNQSLDKIKLRGLIALGFLYF